MALKLVPLGLTMLLAVFGTLLLAFPGEKAAAVEKDPKVGDNDTRGKEGVSVRDV